jgi:hypothetical protein
LQNRAGYGYDSPKYANTDAPGARRPVRRSTNIHVGFKRTTAAGGSIRKAAVEASRFVQKKPAQLQSRGPLAAYLQIVDDILESVYGKLVGDEARLRISFLPEPDGLPLEEKTDDFLAALEHAKVSDIDYLTKLDALEREGRDDEIELARLELQLRERVRSQLGLPPRPTRADINRSEHARSLGKHREIDEGPDSHRRSLPGHPSTGGPGIAGRMRSGCTEAEVLLTPKYFNPACSCTPA